MLSFFVRRSVVVFLFVAATVFAGEEGKTVAVVSSYEIKFSGFVDVQARMDDPSDDSGFLVNDGAFYFETGGDRVKLTVDLPFFGGGDNNDFHFAEEKARAFISVEYDNGVFWELGQFDSIAGFEDNDSIGLDFATWSKVAGAPFPTTHTGLKVGFEGNDNIKISAIVANEVNSGSLHGDVDVGGTLEWEGDTAEGYFTLLSSKAEGGRDSLVDFVLSRKFGAMTISWATGFTKPDAGKDGFGSLLQGIYSHDGPWGWGWRLEKGEHQEHFLDGEAVTIGVNHRFSRQLLFKIDAVYGRQEVEDNSSDVTTKSLVVSGVMRF